MTTALEGGERSASRPGRSLPSVKTRYPLYMRLGGPQGRSGQLRKISPPPRFDTRTFQPVASLYTDRATRAQGLGITYVIRTNKMHTFYISDLVQLYCFRRVSNNQVFILRKTCTCSFTVFLSCIRISNLVDGRMCLGITVLCDLSPCIFVGTCCLEYRGSTPFQLDTKRQADRPHYSNLYSRGFWSSGLLG
jgi:hypothetical protein